MSYEDLKIKYEELKEWNQRLRDTVDAIASKPGIAKMVRRAKKQLKTPDKMKEKVNYKASVKARIFQKKN